MALRHNRSSLLTALFCAAAAHVSQQSAASETADLDLSELVEVKIQVASGQPQAISRAPAVGSVITADQIRAMGASSLNEVLETVAGIHVTPSKVGALDPRYSIRGIASSTGGGMLVLLNGIPITRPAEGGPILGFQLPVTGIQRIEVIRGPGSAIYGADAFSGVIDITTKTAADIDDTRIGLRAGSFDTRDFWLQHGGRWGGWDVAVTLDLRTTDGDADRLILRDRQTALDSEFLTGASLAPGPLATDAEIGNVHLQLNRGGWTARLWGFRNDRGLGAGLGQALDPAGSQLSELLMSDLSYETELAGGDWDLNQTLTYIGSQTDSDFNIFPPGAVLPIGADGNVNASYSLGLVAFPDGLISRPRVEQTTLILDSVARFTRLDDHQLRFNVGAELHQLEADDLRNFGPGVITGAPSVVDGAVTDVSDTEFVFTPDVDREHWYLSFQDQWAPHEHLELTLGARYDHFSDFGGSFNPRLALVWQTRPGLSTKLLYGRAFRAPSFAQLFTRNNPAFLGNPDLRPETNETLELALDGQPKPGLRTAASGFCYQIEDLIVQMGDAGLTSFTAQNAGRQEGCGIELELSWDVSDDLRVESNFAWQRPNDSSIAGERAANEVPRNQFYLAADWRFRPGWRAFFRVIDISGQARRAAESLAELKGYTTVDVTVRRKRLWGRLDVAFLGRNLFDEEGLEPADPVLGDGYPIEGRMLAIELSYPLR